LAKYWAYFLKDDDNWLIIHFLCFEFDLINTAKLKIIKDSSLFFHPCFNHFFYCIDLKSLVLEPKVAANSL